MRQRFTQRKSKNTTSLSAIIAIASILLIVGKNPLFGQKSDRPFIQNYNYTDYNASVSNWNINQDNRGILYFANLKGLLEYDGVNWRLIDIDNGKNALSVRSDSLNKIYIGGASQYGFLDLNPSGVLKYKMLSKPIVDQSNLDQVRKILTSTKGIFFLGINKIIQYNRNKHLSFQPNSAAFSALWQLEDRIYTAENSNGIFEITDDSLLRVPFTHEVTLVSPVRIDKDTLLLFDGISGNPYVMNSNLGIVKLSISDSSFLRENSISTTAYDKDQTIAIGTSKGGIITINKKGESQQLYNERNGLNSNIITDVGFDHQNGLWATTQDGISRIEMIPTWRHWNEENSFDGIIFNMAKFNNDLYIATTNGLYVKKESKFLKVAGTSKRLWHVNSVGDKLYASGDDGFYQIDELNNKAKKILDIGVSRFYQFNSDQVIVQGFRNDLYSLDLTNSESTILSKNDGAVSVSIIHYNNEIWCSSKFDGIYKTIETSNGMVTYKYSKKHGLPDTNEVEILNHQGKLLFATGRGFYKLNEHPLSDSSDYFTPDNSIFSERIKIHNVANDNRGNYWVTVTENGMQHIEKFELNSDLTYSRVITPFKRLPNQEFTGICPDPDDSGIVWIGGAEGLYRFDDNVEKDYEIPFNSLVRKVLTGDSLIFGGAYYDASDTSRVPSILLDQPEAFKPTLTYNNNQLTFEYAATSYEVPEKNRYSYWLKGNDNSWSGWSKETKKEYTNLTAGTYTFYVKSKNVYDTEGRIATYEFTILPPWHQTSWAYLLWAILGGFTVWVIALVYNYRIRMQRRKLKLIVADRTFEVLSQKKEIEKQHNQLLEKTEEIKQQSDVLSEKNVELESQQEEILTINHQLNELNNHLEIEVDNRTKKIKTTLSKLRKTNKELDTFIYRASHDLKSPISRIKGLTSLAKLEIPDDVNRQYFELIEQASNDMKLLLDKLTQLHEVVNKKVTRAAIDLPSLLSTVRESLKHLDKGKNTKYSFNIKDQLELLSDEDIIQVIIENLVENALIFRKSHDEEHHIKIEVFKKDDSILIKVWDNGIGIESEHHVQLFDMFFRASDKSKGSGLGLYLVKMAAEKLEGTVKVKSELDKYTEFTVSFPF